MAGYVWSETYEVQETVSLLSDAMEKCTLIDRISSTDEYGGIVYTWQEGASFNAAVTFDNSIEARQAQMQSVTSLYTVTTERDINLQYHQVFRRERDGKIFRVTSDGDDNYTPKSATLNMRQVNAEEYEPSDG